jgi:hypothetical protein
MKRLRQLGTRRTGWARGGLEPGAVPGQAVEGEKGR